MNYNVAEAQNILRIAYESAIAKKPAPAEIETLNRVVADAFEPLKRLFASNLMSNDIEELKKLNEKYEQLQKDKASNDADYIEKCGEVGRLLTNLEKTKKSGVQLQEIIDKLTNDNQEMSHNWQNCLEGNKTLKAYADKKEDQFEKLLNVLVGVTNGNNSFI
jgi:chromosome segregation ATPase